MDNYGNYGPLKLGPRFVKGRGYTVKTALFDVDNTLVGNGAPDVPTERFRQAVAAAQKAGIAVGLASARPLSKVRHILDFIQADSLSILCNGSQIINSYDGSVTAEWYISPETCAALIKKLLAMDVVFWINDDGVDYFPTTDNDRFERLSDIWDNQSRRIAVPDYLPSKPFVINLHAITQEQADAATAMVKNIGDPDVTTLISHEVRQPDGSLLYDQFIVHKQGNKRHALHEVARLQGVPLGQCMAVGDGRNDAVLVGEAGVGVAMGNSALETLDVASFIAPNRKADGAAIALEVFSRH